MPNHSTHYDTLQISESAEPEIIEAAYRRLARMRHPDVNKSPAAHAEMSAINSAYDILKDSAKRARYDIELSNQRRRRAQSANPPPPSQPPSPNHPPRSSHLPRSNKPSSPHRAQSRADSRPRRPVKPEAPRPPPVSVTLKSLPYIPALIRAIACGGIAAILTAALTITLSDVQWGSPIAAIIAIAMNGCMLAALCYMCAIGPFSIWARPAARAALIAASAALIAIAAIAIAAQWLYLNETGADPSSTFISVSFAAGFGLGYASRLYQAR